MFEAMPILAMDDVVSPGGPGDTVAVPALVVRAGTAVVVHVRGRDDGLPPLCDLAVGTLAPVRGTVRFMGEDWGLLKPFRHGVLRGRVGRVFAGQAWVSNLSVAENVLLPQRHHTRRSESDLVDEAHVLARAFGLATLPAARPEALRPNDLVRWQWVRAFLGAPRLLVLEEPEAGAWEEQKALLRERTRLSVRDGSAVLWVTRDESVWRNPAAPSVLHAVVDKGKLSCESEAS